MDADMEPTRKQTVALQQELEQEEPEYYLAEDELLPQDSPKAVYDQNGSTLSYYTVAPEMRDYIHELIEDSSHVRVTYRDGSSDDQGFFDPEDFYEAFQEDGHTYEILHLDKEDFKGASVCGYELRMFWSPDESELTRDGVPEKLSDVYVPIIFRGVVPDAEKLSSPPSIYKNSGWRGMTDTAEQYQLKSAARWISNHWDTYEHVYSAAKE